jgi:hypothetical protein
MLLERKQLTVQLQPQIGCGDSMEEVTHPASRWIVT